MIEEYVLICLVSLIASGLTFFSGFGLGTILVPVFAIFFPLEIAITLTAIVHFLNNLFKFSLVGKHTSRSIVIRFGLPAIVAAFIGAYLLTIISNTGSLFSYAIFNKTANVTLVKLVVGLLLSFFALVDLIPQLSRLNFSQKYIPLGGFLSGFFGGLSGNQGALRAAFLSRANLSKEQFIATGVVIAVLIDVSRLAIYFADISKHHHKMDYLLVALATLSAFAGAFIGNRILKKVTVKFFQNFVAITLFIFSIFLISGIL